MNHLFIMGILIDKRKEAVPNVQALLTQYADSIIARFGVHDPAEEPHGLITLTLRDKKEQVEALAQALEPLDGVTCNWVQMK